MNKSCFLAPIHDAKFKYGGDFVKSYNDIFNDDNIFLVFSSEKECEGFNKQHKVRYNAIIYTDSYDPELKGIITTKKWFGLNYIYSNTDYQNVAVMDVDSLFVKKVDYNKLFDQYITDQKIHSNFIHDNPDIKSLQSQIVTNCVKFFKPEDQKLLEKITYNFKTLFWFNNIPIYHKPYYLEFLDYIDYEKIKYEICWLDFDYIVYAYYLMVTNRLKLELLDLDISLEHNLLDDHYRLSKDKFIKAFTGYNPMWIKSEIDAQYMKNVFMKVHVDRK